MTLTNGSIKNIFGRSESFFTKFSNTILAISTIDTISSYAWTSSSFLHAFYTALVQSQRIQASLFYATSTSEISITACTISSLDTQSKSSTLPLLIFAGATSTVLLKDTIIYDLTFTNSAIDINGVSEITIENTNFSNINKVVSTSRLLSTKRQTSTATVQSSMILISGSILTTLNGSKFENIRCELDCNGSVFNFISSQFSLSDTTISSSKATTAGAMYVAGIASTNTISNCQFLNNVSAGDAGALYISALASDIFSLKIIDSSFTNNIAQAGNGGAIFISSEQLNSEFQSITISSSTIQSNEAQVGGGIHSSSISALISSDTLIFGNIGHLFGNNSISYPTHVEIKNFDEFKTANSDAILVDLNGEVTLTSFRSGASLGNLVFKFMNDAGEEMYPVTNVELASYTTSISIDLSSTSDHSSYKIRGTTSVTYTKNTSILQHVGFAFTDVSIVGIPDSQVTLLIKSDSIKELDTDSNTFVDTYSFKLHVHFRECIGGERVTQYSDFTECSPCEAGSYSFDMKSCYDCPAGAKCSGGSSLLMRNGYWRESSATADVIECMNLTENCIGGTYGNNVCFEGHIGALCEECDIFGTYWGESYARSGKYVCVKCSEIKNNLWIVILMTIWTLISMVLAIKGDIESLEQATAIETIQKNVMRKQILRKQSNLTPGTMTVSGGGGGAATATVGRSLGRALSRKISMNSPGISEGKSILTQQQQSQQQQPPQLVTTTSSFIKPKQLLSSEQEDKSGIYIKLLTNYMQIVASVATFNLDIPSGLFEFPDLIGNPVQQTMNSLDCAIKDLDSAVPIIYLRLIFSLIIPIVYMFIFCAGLFVQYFLKKQQKQQNQQPKRFPLYVLSTALIFLVIYVQPDLISQMIESISCRTVGSKEYILADVSYECNSSNHSEYSAFLVVPMLFVWAIAIPLFLFWLLYRHRESLSTVAVKLKYGFLYKEYTEDAFYWEFVKMGVKIAIILSLNFYSQSIVTKGILVFIAITFYGILALIIHPYRDTDINSIDVHSTNACAITVLLALFIYKNDFNYFVYTSFAVIIIINVTFLYSIVKLIIKEYVKVFEEMLSGALKSFVEKVPFLKRFQRKQIPQRKINMQVKNRMRNLMLKFINLDPEHKKKIVVQIFQQQLEQKHAKFFAETPGQTAMDVSKPVSKLHESSSRNNHQSAADPDDVCISIDSPILEIGFQEIPVFNAVKQFPQIETFDSKYHLNRPEQSQQHNDFLDQSPVRLLPVIPKKGRQLSYGIGMDKVKENEQPSNTPNLFSPRLPN